jgi:hypothetical protein
LIGNGGLFFSREAGRLSGEDSGSGRPSLSDDGAQDVLTGTSGQDWFLANVSGGGVNDKLTDLSAAEFATDLAFINGL